MGKGLDERINELERELSTLKRRYQLRENMFSIVTQSELALLTDEGYDIAEIIVTDNCRRKHIYASIAALRDLAMEDIISALGFDIENRHVMSQGALLGDEELAEFGGIIKMLDRDNRIVISVAKQTVAV